MVWVVWQDRRAIDVWDAGDQELRRTLGPGGDMDGDSTLIVPAAYNAQLREEHMQAIEALDREKQTNEAHVRSLAREQQHREALHPGASLAGFRLLLGPFVAGQPP